MSIILFSLFIDRIGYTVAMVFFFASYLVYTAIAVLRAFYRDPQCSRDYTIEVMANGKWQRIVEEQNNYQRLRRHTLAQPAVTDRLRVVIHTTNGDFSAFIYEVRCY